MEDYPKVYLYRRIVQAKLYIDKNYAENIDVSHISDEASFSKFHFIRQFRKIYGKTPHQHLTSIRMEQAKLLLQSPMPIAEVCFSVGFESVSSFTGLFKRYMHLTPFAYQQRQIRRQHEINSAPLKFVPGCFAEQKGWTKKSNFQELL